MKIIIPGTTSVVAVVDLKVYTVPKVALALPSLPRKYEKPKILHGDYNKITIERCFGNKKKAKEEKYRCKKRETKKLSKKYFL